MKNNKMFSRLGVAMVAILLLSSIQFSLASGTAAGTAITNTANVTFTDGGNTKNKTSNTVSLYVGHKVAGAFTPTEGSITTYDNVTYYYPVSYQNTSNRPTPYTISFNSNSGYTLSLVADVDNSGTFTAGDTTFTYNRDSIGVDVTKHYLIKAVVATVADLNIANIVLTLTNAGVNHSANNIVVLNPAFTKTFALTSTINKPIVSFTVSGSAPSPLIPGAAFNYSIAFDNSGSATPYSYNNVSGLVRFTYTIPTNFTFGGGGSGTLALTGGAGGTIAYSVSGSVITFTLDTTKLAPALAATSFTLPITINQSLVNGTGPAPGQPVITATTDFSSIAYGSGQNPLTQSVSASGTIFNGTAVVATSIGGKFTVTPSNANVAANETNEYVYTLKNMGNAAATFTFTDVQDGVDLDTEHLIAQTSNGTDLGTNPTVSVDPGTTIQVYVRVTVPGSASNGQSIVRKITVTSGGIGTLYTGAVLSDYEHTITTNVVSSTFSITLAAESIFTTNGGTTSNPYPGDVITFTLTVENTGGTAISNILISNLIPTGMTFVSNGFSDGKGIKIDTIEQTNDNDGVDDAYYDGSSIRTKNTFAIGASSSKVIRYKCTVN